MRAPDRSLSHVGKASSSPLALTRVEKIVDYSSNAAPELRFTSGRPRAYGKPNVSKFIERSQDVRGSMKFGKRKVNVGILSHLNSLFIFP